MIGYYVTNLKKLMWSNLVHPLGPFSLALSCIDLLQLPKWVLALPGSSLLYYCNINDEDTSLLLLSECYLNGRR